jgi:hypothetical protein
MRQYKKFSLTKRSLLLLLVAEFILIPWGLLNLAIDNPHLDSFMRVIIGIVWLWLPIAVYQKASSIGQYRKTAILMIFCTYLVAILAGLLWLFFQSLGFEVSYWFKSESGKVYRIYDRPSRGTSLGFYSCRMVDRYDRVFPGLLYLRGPIHAKECYETAGGDEPLPPLKTLKPTPNNPFP